MTVQEYERERQLDAVGTEIIGKLSPRLATRILLMPGGRRSMIYRQWLKRPADGFERAWFLSRLRIQAMSNR